MIINPYLVQPSGPSYGTLTTAWIAATGETDLTILGALNTLESDMATYGLTAKMKALYPMVGGTAAKHKYNFMDARDLDAAYRLVFTGGWTHSSTGAKPNGTNAYADTKLTPSSVLTQDNTHISYYSRDNISASCVDMGCRGTVGGTADLSLYNYSGTYYSDQYNTGGGRASSANADTRGFITGSRTTSAIHKLFRNGTQIGSTNTGASGNLSFVTVSIALAALGTTLGFYSPREIAIASIGDGLTDAEAANFYTAVQTFQTTLARQVGVPIVSDSDAQAFLNAAVITDTTQASAVNTLVTGLKADGLWTKMAAIYPMVGGTATAHSYNLKNTAAYQLTFNGGWTHSSTGALPNGTNAYADTSFNVNTYKDNNHLSYYIRTNLDEVRVDAGLIGSIGQYFDVESRISNVGYFGNHIAAVNVNFAVTDSRGLWLNTRTTSTLQKVYKNGTSQGSNTASGTTAINGNIYLGARNVVGTGANLYSTKQTAFASIGDGLDDTDAANLYTRVQTYQTALSRNV